MKTPFLRCVLFLFALSASALAQGRPGGSRPSTGSVGSSSSQSTSSSAPSSASSNVFVSGKVVIDDGTEMTEPAVIQTICRSQRHNEAYSDSHGNFSFRFGDPTERAAASISDASSSSPNNRTGMGSSRDLRDCQIQAELPGFSSQPVEVGSHIDMMNSVDVGRLTLHRLAHVDGTSISVTSYQAPPAAKKAFEKGIEQGRKGKWEEAQKSLEKAVQIYPRYAVAWYQLGQLQMRNLSPKQLGDEDAQAAKHSFEQAVAADPKYVYPYDGLAQLAMRASDWPNVVDLTNKLIALNPVNFPEAYYGNGVANYYLKNFDQAEKSALQGVRVDTAHQIPKLQYLLGMTFLQKQDYQAASEHMQLYLSLAKQPEEIELAKQGLAQIEKVSASAAQPPVVDLDK
jgi:tetratricopeptide (TPR) repeat protein